MRITTRIIAFTSALALVLLVSHGDAFARGGGKGARAQGSGKAHTTVTRTGHNGRTATWQKDTQWRRGDGSADRSTTWTHPGGKTRSAETHAERTEDGHTRNTTFTDARGRTATREVDVVRDRETGVIQRSTVHEGRNGNIRTREDLTTRTETGRTTHSTITGPQGRTATRDVEVTRDAEAGTRIRDVVWTGPEGQTGSRVTESARTDDGFHRTTTVTSPTGETRTWERDVSREIVIDPN